MILLYDRNMCSPTLVSIPEDTTWKLCIQQFDGWGWGLALQVIGEKMDEILYADDFIDVGQEENKEAIGRVRDLFNRIIHATARTMARSNDDSILDLGSILRREIERWDKEKELCNN